MATVKLSADSVVVVVAVALGCDSADDGGGDGRRPRRAC